MTDAPTNAPRSLSEKRKRQVEAYLSNMRRTGLKLDVRAVVDSIARQFHETGWLSFKQIDVLRRCCVRSNLPNRMGGFGQGPCYGRNAPAGRGSGPIG